MSAGWFDNASCLQTPYKIIMNGDHSTILNLNNNNNKQGLSSVLNSDSSSSNTINYNNINSNHNSIRRTLSAADMASQKWLTPFKRVHSSLQLQVLGEDQSNIGEDHDDCNKSNGIGSGQAFEEIWSSIQADKKSWGSILSPGKADGSGSGSGQLPPPYVHPLAKRSASSLSEKSLEICTESLGSETGSDGFSYPPSEPEDEHEHEEEVVKEKEEEQEEVEEKGSIVVEVGNYKCNNNSTSLRGPTVKRSMMVPPVRPSFPPPLPSLAHRNDGSNLHIRSHRQDGRLVVEAVAVPSQNCLRAQRQDGRLLLTLSTSMNDQQVHEPEHEHIEMFETAAEEVDEEVEVLEEEGEEEEVLAIPREVMNVRRSCTGFTMSKLMELTNTRNKSTWPRKYNKTVIKTLDDNEEEMEDEEVDDELTVMQSSLLPPRPRVSTATAAAVALNAYEYYWRRNNSPAAAAVAMLNPLVGHKNNKNNNNNCALQVEKDSKRNNNNKLLYAAHNRKGVSLAQAHQDVVLLKAAGTEPGTETGTGAATAAEKTTEYLIPLMLRGCKEPKRSLLFWEPPCIATS